MIKIKAKYVTTYSEYLRFNQRFDQRFASIVKVTDFLLFFCLIDYDQYYYYCYYREILRAVERSGDASLVFAVVRKLRNFFAKSPILLLFSIFATKL